MSREEMQGLKATDLVWFRSGEEEATGTVVAVDAEGIDVRWHDDFENDLPYSEHASIERFAL